MWTSLWRMGLIAGMSLVPQCVMSSREFYLVMVCVCVCYKYFEVGQSVHVCVTLMCVVCVCVCVCVCVYVRAYWLYLCIKEKGICYRGIGYLEGVLWREHHEIFYAN